VALALPVALAVPVLLSGACTGSLFQDKTPPSTMYLLTAKARTGKTAAASTAPPPPAAAPALSANVDLAILRPRVRAGLDTDRIALLYPDRRLDYFAGARWSGPLEEVMQDLALEAFHSSALMHNVAGEGSAFASTYWLELEVEDFQAEYAAAAGGAAPPTVHVRLLARLGLAANRRVIAHLEADARQVATENRLGAIVDAYDEAVDRALREIIGDLAAPLAADSTAP
jgi:cholesterol transport system auxiliary component